MKESSAGLTSESSTLLHEAIEARRSLFEGEPAAALRLFNGFVEGLPSLAIDLYASTVVVHDASDSGNEGLVRDVAALVRERVPQTTAVLWKARQAAEARRRNGVLVFGTPTALSRRVVENGVGYAVDLTMNRDASLYLDTRHLRRWAKENLAGKRVLNTFAYTGSLGVAAKAAGADVVHTDLNRRFLTVAKDSYTLNGFPIERRDFRTGDFFGVVGQLKRENALFDCVFIDPPFFSVTRGGRVDLESDFERLVNKVRPLVADGGSIVVVNNAVYLSGSQFLQRLESLCADGYLTIDDFVPVPDDSAGYPATRRGPPPANPAPFNHSTKIAVLGVRRKDARSTGLQE